MDRNTHLAKTCPTAVPNSAGGRAKIASLRRALPSWRQTRRDRHHAPQRTQGTEAQMLPVNRRSSALGITGLRIVLVASCLSNAPRNPRRAMRGGRSLHKRHPPADGLTRLLAGAAAHKPRGGSAWHAEFFHPNGTPMAIPWKAIRTRFWCDGVAARGTNAPARQPSLTQNTPRGR